MRMEAGRIGGASEREKWRAVSFARKDVRRAGCGSRPGSAMNSLRSAWTAVLACPEDR